MNGDIRIAIECTDKDQHPWTLLGDLTMPALSLLRANVGFTYGEREKRLAPECVWLDHLDKSNAEYRVHMRCPRCKRHIQWTYQNAIDKLSRLRDAGLNRLDISAIP